MPTVSIEMLPGRTPQQKIELAAQVTDAVVAALGVVPDAVKVKLYEIEPFHSAVGGLLKAVPPAPDPGSGVADIGGPSPK